MTETNPPESSEQVPGAQDSSGEPAGESAHSAKRLRIEAIVASPPTKKCRAALAAVEEMTRLFPDQVRVDVYQLGRAWPRTPTMPCLLEFKSWRAPSVYVNGRAISRAEPPDPTELETAIREELAKGPEAWEN